MNFMFVAYPAQLSEARTGLVLHISDCIGEAGNKALNPTILAHECFDATCSSSLGGANGGAIVS